MRTAKAEGNENAKIKVIPLGGLEAIGMNITVFEYEDEIIVVDCGLSFPNQYLTYHHLEMIIHNQLL